MRRTIGNVFWLGTKELHAFSHDFVLVALVIWAFSLSIISIARSNLQELHDEAIGIADEDQSELSRRISHAFLQPYFKAPRPISEHEIEPLMNTGELTFAIDIPINFQRDLQGRRDARIQIYVDATAMMQAGIGAGYAQQIITREIESFLSRSEAVAPEPVGLDVRIAFNPNLTSAWFMSVMGLINNVTMLAIILAGAAIVREREHGTMDHLLVMPLTPFEIAISKIWSNGLVIVVAVASSLAFGRRDLCVLRDGNRDLSRHRGAFNAPARVAVHASRDSNEHALGEPYAAREHAAFPAHRHASIALHALRFVCPGHPLPGRRIRRGLAAVPRGRPDRRGVPGPRAAAVSKGHRTGEVRPPRA